MSQERYPNARVIAIANQKGGAAKTTTTAELAVALGRLGRRVLAIDLDPQANLTAMFARYPGVPAASVFGVMAGLGGLPAATDRGVAPGVDLLRGHREMRRLELMLVGETRREDVLGDQLAGAVDDYDAVLLDCPPNLGLLTVNALCAAPEVLIPVAMTDRNAYAGAHALIEAVGQLAEKRLDVRVWAVVRTLVDRRRLVYDALERRLDELDVRIAATEIPLRAAFHTAAAIGRPVGLAHADSRGALAYLALAEELLEPAASPALAGSGQRAA